MKVLYLETPTNNKLHWKDKVIWNVLFQLYDSKEKRYEVPVPMPSATSKASDPKYKVEFKADPFSLKIVRKENGAIL